MDRRPWSRRHSKRMLVAVVGILGIGVVALGGVWIALAPGTSPSQSPPISPSAVVAVASGSPSSAGSTAGSGVDSSADSSASPTASDGPSDSVEPSAADSGLLPAEPTASVVPSPSAASTPSPTAAPTATRTATPPPPTTAAPTPITPKPNLAFALHPAVPNPICGQATTLTATIVNTGHASSVHTNFYLFDQYPFEHAVASDYTGVPALHVGDTATVSVTWTVTVSCGRTHRLVLRIDAAANNDETDEEDNYLRIPYDIRGPNVYPSDLTVPAHPACASVTVGVRVNNNGNIQATSGLLRFTDTVSGISSYSKTVYASFPNIPAGTSRIVSQTFPALAYCNRTHTIRAFVDSGGTVAELDETDNSMQVDYHPDL